MYHFSHTQNLIAATPPASPAETATQNTVLTSLVLVLPLLLILGVLGRRKYRTAVRQRRIKWLERMWQLSHEEKKS